MQSNESNTAKSRRGNSFNKDVAQLMRDLLRNKKIKKFISEPRYNYPSKQKKQFNPDGEITELNGDLIIYDNTTSIRSDRLKQKSWDAYGTKEHFKSQKIDIKYYVITPDDLKTEEKENARQERQKLQDKEYYNTIDDILTISELINMI
ncbi:MAG: hypothetical protein WBM44_17990 [Waterburya sp.]